MDNDTLRLLSPVSDEVRNQGKVQQIGTLLWAMLQKIFSVALVIAIYILPILCKKYDCQHPRSSLVVYLHVATYVVQMILHIIIEYEHAKNRRLGYLQFHESTKIVRRTPIAIYGAGTLALLLLQTILLNETGDHQLLTFGGAVAVLTSHRITIFGVSLGREDFYSILVTVQVLLVLPFNISYIVKVVKFRSLMPPPDVYSEEDLLTSYMRHQPNAEVGISERSPVETLLSKQADKIEYLEDHNKRLGQKLVEMTQRMAEMQGNASRC